jgi:LysM repeat protein
VSGPFDSNSDDPHDFWAEMPTRPLGRITSRRKPTTRRKSDARRPRQHGETQQIPVIDADGVIILDDTACRPFDGDTGLGGMSPGDDRTRALQGPNNPLLRRVGAMMVLLALGVPVAMALRGGDSGRTSLGTGAAEAIAAAQESATTETTALSAQEVAQAAGEVAVTLTGAAVTPTEQASTETAAPETAAPAVVAPAVVAAAVQPVAAPACVKTYTVVLGDGWLLIAEKHSIGVGELLASNGANLSTFLMVGSTICVPANASTPTTDPPATTPPATHTAAAVYVAPFSLACAKTYVVVLGDGWLRIANKHGVAMKDLLKVNAATAGTFLMVGRKICVPANATAPTVATTTTVKTKTTHPPPTPTLHPPDRTYTPAEVEAIIREIWPDDLEEEALRIAKRESHLNPRAQNYCCYGLFQIYFNVHKKWLAEMGVTSGEQLLDPTVAAKAGLKLYQRNGWGPWKL